MKKLLAITVIFALVAGAAFAETSLGGSVEVQWQIAENDGTSGAKTTTSGKFATGDFNLSTANDEGTYGGKFKIVFNGSDPTEAAHEVLVDRTQIDAAFAWWQPIEQVKFWVGKDGDGMFNTANLTRWGHFKMPRNITIEDWKAGDYMLGNWDKFGMALMIYPMEGLQINFAFPVGGFEDNRPAMEHSDWFKGMQAQVGYNLDGVGNFFLTYQGETAGDAFGLTYQSAGFVEGLNFEIGFNYKGIANERKDDNLFFGVGAHFTKDAFGVKFRMFMHPTKSAGDDVFKFTADIMPFYEFDFGTLFLNINFHNFYSYDDRLTGDNGKKIGWYVAPYLQLKVGVGDMRVGVRIEDLSGGGDIGFYVPLSMVVSF